MTRWPSYPVTQWPTYRGHTVDPSIRSCSDTLQWPCRTVLARWHSRTTWRTPDHSNRLHTLHEPQQRLYYSSQPYTRSIPIAVLYQLLNEPVTSNNSNKKAASTIWNSLPRHIRVADSFGPLCVLVFTYSHFTNPPRDRPHQRSHVDTLARHQIYLIIIISSNTSGPSTSTLYKLSALGYTALSKSFCLLHI